MKQPLNIVNVSYAQTKASVNTDALGMREMQQRVFAQREAQHLLVKAPPASGKSRALMFVALDKLYNQGRKKVIVAVPERSIGASFASTNLTKFGFWADWDIKEEHNLCDAGSSAGRALPKRRHPSVFPKRRSRVTGAARGRGSRSRCDTPGNGLGGRSLAAAAAHIQRRVAAAGR